VNDINNQWRIQRGLPIRKSSCSVPDDYVHNPFLSCLKHTLIDLTDSRKGLLHFSLLGPRSWHPLVSWPWTPDRPSYVLPMLGPLARNRLLRSCGSNSSVCLLHSFYKTVISLHWELYSSAFSLQGVSDHNI